MSDTDSSNSIIGEENFPAMAPESVEHALKRRLTCPGEHTLAAYVDGGLGQNKNRRLERHLAKCQYCRSIVADVVKLQRAVELPVPPFEMARKPLVFAPSTSKGAYWIWASAAAMALVLVTAVVLRVVREPQKLMVVSLPTRSAPAIAKAEPPAPVNSPVRNITRKPQAPKTAPVLLSPLQDSTVVRNQLEITWKPLSPSRYFEISLVTSEGDLLWEGQTERTSLRLPSDVVLKRGSYFVWVTAYLGNGQVTKSSPVRFRVQR